MNPRRAHLTRLAALSLIIILALGLRLCGNTYGLPNQYAPDEAAKAAVARAYREHPFQHANSQPSFLYSSLFLTDLAADALEPAIRAFHPRAAELFPADCGREPILIWLGRCLMALISALTCVVIYRLGREVHGHGAGLAAAWLFAVIPLPVSAATYIKEDTPLTFFVALGLLAGMRYARKQTLISAMLAGVAAGAAFASKFPGALMLMWVMGVVAAVWWQRNRDGHSNPLKPSALETITILAAFLLTFLVICPGLAIRPASLFSGVGFQIDYMQRGHHDSLAFSPREFAFLFYLTRALIPGVGILTLLAAAGGAAILWRRDRTRVALLIAWGFGYYLLAETMKSKPYPFFHRYILPVTPVLAVLAGIMIQQCFALSAHRRFAAQWKNTALEFSAMAVMLTPLILTLIGLSPLSPDTRDQARRWISEHLGPSDMLLQSGYGTVWNEPVKFAEAPLSEQAIMESRRTIQGGNVYVLLSSFACGRYLEHPLKIPQQTKFYSDLIASHETAARFEQIGGPFGFHNPDIIILRLTPRD